MKLSAYIISLYILLIPISAISQETGIMSFNIRYDNDWDTINSWNQRKDAISDLINLNKPSILGIQEGLYNQVKFLKENLTDYSYVGVGRGDGESQGEYCAIFYDTSIFRVIKDSTFWLSQTPGRVSVGWDAALERICTYGLFEEIASSKRIWIFNTHFDHKGDIARIESSKLILKEIEQINNEGLPVILMGDFNLTSKEKPIQIIEGQLSDALEITEAPLSGEEGTFNGFSTNNHDKRIDYIFTSSLRVLSYSHIDKRLDNGKHISDHFPVYIIIKLN